MKTVRLDCSRRDVLQYRNVHGVFAWSWLSLYGGRFPSESLPPLEMRTMTRDVAGHLLLPDDVPNGKTQPFMFMVRLLIAWIRMRFRVPPIAFVEGSLDDQTSRAN